jgi:glycosyltransferase involved in cell wall biosynthesis
MTSYELPQMKYSEQKGLVSIIVPIYNIKETYLRECLDSILAQTFSNWETVLVNDGSLNNTEKIINEYAKKDSRFIAIHKQKNEGSLLARKTGLENSRGEFIANLDADDTHHSQFLEKMHAKMIETNADFAWCKFQCLRGGKKQNMKEKSDYYTTDYEWSENACENVAMMLKPGQGASLSMCGNLIKRDVYAKVLFPSIYLIQGEDPLQMLQVAYHSKSATFVPEKLYYYKISIGTSTYSNPLPWVKAAVFLKKTLEILFNATIPCNVEKALCYYVSGSAAKNYFLLDKKTREQFKDELEPLLPKLIKAQKKLNLKICLFLANKGIEFPLRLRKKLRDIYKIFF